MQSVRLSSPKPSVTPKSRRVCVVGRLDMVRMSSRAFAIHLDESEEELIALLAEIS